MAGPPAPYKAGDVLNGRYQIEGEINRGATAVVYSARDMSNNNKSVALKVLDCPQHVPVRVVKREIALSSAVGGHPNLASLLDVFAASRRELVIVWEKIAGPDLLELLNETGSPLEEGRAAFLIAQLLRAVAFLHASGFAHRDVKAENALVETSSQQLKLIDFGLSKHIQSVATLGVGTPDYMAPELLQQQQRPPPPPQPSLHNNNNSNNTAAAAASTTPPYDARAADAWSIGVLFYLLLAGAYPFEDENHPSSVAHTVANVLAGRRRPLPEWSSHDARRVVSGLLQPDPQLRTTLRELAADPWLVKGATEYAKGVPGGMQLVDLSAVAKDGRGGGGGGGASGSSNNIGTLLGGGATAPSSAAAAASAPPPPSSSSAPATVKIEQQVQQQQQQQPSPPSQPQQPATPPAAKGGAREAVRRLLASVAWWPQSK